MVRRVLAFALCVMTAALICLPGCAEEEVPQETAPAEILSRAALEEMTVDELLALQALVNEILEQKGFELYIEIVHGDKGDHVTRLQTRLKELGYYTGRISGKYDNLTEKAVKSFQKDNGLASSSTATRETQVLLFSTDASGAATAAPKATATPAPTVDPVLADYVEIDYRDCARNPEKHIDQRVVIKGVVVQVIGTKNDKMVVRLRMTSGDVVYLNIPRGTVDYNILENDRLTVYATMQELKTYTSTLNQSITIPQAKAVYIILN